MKRIAVLTSGGDAPGMNAAIRAVVRAGIDQGWEVHGVRGGYRGLIEGDFVPLRARDVGGVIHLAGTFLGSARCAEFRTDEGKETALGALSSAGTEGLAVMRGNGAPRGARALPPP